MYKPTLHQKQAVWQAWNQIHFEVVLPKPLYIKASKRASQAFAVGH
jgi:hypothetical protein